MNIQEQKDIGKDLLDKLEILDPYVVIAGGAARDWHLGEKANDLDIYLCYHPNLTLGSNKRSIAKALNFTEDYIETLGVQFNENIDQQNDYAINPNVRCVYELTYKGMKVQIINMHTEFVRVQDFCFSICQAYTTDCESIRTTEDFDYSVKHKIIFKTGEFYSAKMQYINKMKDRFPNYLFVESKPVDIISSMNLECGSSKVKPLKPLKPVRRTLDRSLEGVF